MKKKLIISTFFLTSCFLYQKMGSGWITSWDFDSASYLFFTFLPLIWLFKIKSKTNGLLALFFLLSMAVTYVFNYAKIAENMSIIAFYFITTSVLQNVTNFIKDDK